MARNGRVFTPPATRKHETHLARAARRAWPHKPLEGVLGIRVDAYWARPVKPRKGHPCRDAVAEAFPLAMGGKYPDSDNVLKAVSDALNGVVYADDAQISLCIAQRWWAEVGRGSRVEVAVWVLGEQ